MLLGGKEKMKMTYDEYDEMLEVFLKKAIVANSPDPVEIAKMKKIQNNGLNLYVYCMKKGKTQVDKHYSRTNLKSIY